MTNTPFDELISLPTPYDPPVPLAIDCGTCSECHSATCDDCVVTFLLGRRPGEALVIDLEEHRSLQVLAEAGLAPPLRHSSGDR